ncbi:MAG: helix-turn-helix domain-containing protein [Spirochaetales bacterium]|jgi:transcriptional regulator with XRE-family HTH domain|nr:helix-turn-helix domain-containing protein [Spirochaetales bacterium]
MKILSAVKLSNTVSELRNSKNLTQAELGERTGLHRIMIGRIEREDFIPSIVQLEALANVLGFEITDMFVEKEQSQSFIALRSESMNDVEQEGVDTLLGMMLALRQQILLRRKFEHESENQA